MIEFVHIGLQNFIHLLQYINVHQVSPLCSFKEVWTVWVLASLVCVCQGWQRYFHRPGTRPLHSHVSCTGRRLGAILQHMSSCPVSTLTAGYDAGCSSLRTQQSGNRPWYCP